MDDEREGASDVLQPLLRLLQGGHQRVIARPGRVWADRSDGTSATAEIAWGEAQAAQARELISGPMRLPGGESVRWVDTLLVLQAPPDPLCRLDDLATQGWLSRLSARLISATLRVGRNILVVGPPSPARTLIAAALAEGQRPAVLGEPAAAVPAGWPLVGHVDDAVHLGADRIGAWAAPPEAVTVAMGQGCGVAARLEARSLERGLMRFEAASEDASGRSTTPLHVLASLDLVVVLDETQPPRVRQVAEIALYEDGYRPQLLFATGYEPAPSALMPVKVPTYVEELIAAGDNVLVDELRHAAPEKKTGPETRDVGRPNNQPMAESMVEPPPQHSGAESAAVRPEQDVATPGEREAAASPPLAIAEQPTVLQGEEPVPRMPELDATLKEAPPPGWELDQLDDSEVTGAATSGYDSQEAAALAATYGLGPPPPPSGNAVGTFRETMRKVKQRDEGSEQPGTTLSDDKDTFER